MSSKGRGSFAFCSPDSWLLNRNDLMFPANKLNSDKHNISSNKEECWEHKAGLLPRF